MSPGNRDALEGLSGSGRTNSQLGILQRAEGSGIPSWVCCSVRKEVQKLTDWTDPKWALKHSFAKARLPLGRAPA